MATLSISRRFEVAAPPERVWTYLTTPELVVTCLPGAALVSSSADGLTHEGTVTIKLGAMGVSYRGTAEFEEVNSDARTLRVRAKGREKTGAGSAEMTMEAEVVATAEGGSEVALEASASVSGKIVTLGRGMIEVVSEQVLSEFASCLSERLGETGGPAEQGDEARGGAPIGETGNDATPANALGLVWRALKSWLGTLFGRR